MLRTVARERDRLLLRQEVERLKRLGYSFQGDTEGAALGVDTLGFECTDRRIETEKGEEAMTETKFNITEEELVPIIYQASRDRNIIAINEAMRWRTAYEEARLMLAARALRDVAQVTRLAIQLDKLAERDKAWRGLVEDIEKAIALAERGEEVAIGRKLRKELGYSSRALRKALYGDT